MNRFREFLAGIHGDGDQVLRAAGGLFQEPRVEGCADLSFLQNFPCSICLPDSAGTGSSLAFESPWHSNHIGELVPLNHQADSKLKPLDQGSYRTEKQLQSQHHCVAKRTILSYFCRLSPLNLLCR